jgi:thiol-disulfide isomerase/thioredoxin
MIVKNAIVERNCRGNVMKIRRSTCYSALLTVLVIVLAFSVAAGNDLTRLSAQDDTPTATDSLAATAVPTDDSVAIDATTNATAEATAQVDDSMLTLTAIVISDSGEPTETPGYQTDIVKTGMPHFLDFNAVWCQPCNVMRPYVSRLKRKYEGQITFDSFDVDQETSADVMAHYYPIGTIIPYMLLLDKNLKVVKRLDGLITENDLDAELQSLIEPQ